MNTADKQEVRSILSRMWESDPKPFTATCRTWTAEDVDILPVDTFQTAAQDAVTALREKFPLSMLASIQRGKDATWVGFTLTDGRGGELSLA